MTALCHAWSWYRTCTGSRIAVDSNKAFVYQRPYSQATTKALQLVWRPKPMDMGPVAKNVWQALAGQMIDMPWIAASQNAKMCEEHAGQVLLRPFISQASALSRRSKTNPGMQWPNLHILPRTPPCLVPHFKALFHARIVTNISAKWRSHPSHADGIPPGHHLRSVLQLCRQTRLPLHSVGACVHGWMQECRACMQSRS